MEGDAGANRLKPADSDDSSSSEVKSEDSSESEIGADQTSTEVKSEDSSESEIGADQTSTEVKSEDSSESEIGADQTSTETTAEGLPETNAEAESEVGDSPVVEGNPSRLGRRWLIGITTALLVVAGGVATGGYLALRANQESQAIARHDAQAVQAAKDCVAATQAPDTAAMAAGAQKIIDCSTGAFRSQAILYSSLFVEAYQAANVHVQLSDMRAAAERSNADGSVDVLVAFRVKSSNSQTQNREIGYRLRATMAPDQGQYRIAKLDQVAK
jgi:Mce-associated membrane protein